MQNKKKKMEFKKVEIAIFGEKTYFGEEEIIYKS